MPTIAELALTAANDGWPTANPLLGTAVFRQIPEDFIVTESLSFDASGDGEFALVSIRKTDRNTADVANELARQAGVSSRDVSWAGRKDRRAVATQWFCVHLPGQTGPDWEQLGGDGWEVIEAARHHRKLRIGALRANGFEIRLRGVTCDREALDERISILRGTGVPNYFGPQRFGRGGSNLRTAVSGRRLRRNERSMVLSAARSALFNAVLAQRVSGANWNHILPGEVPMLSESNAVFGPEADLALLESRALTGDIDPTGPLWGDDALRTELEVAALETAVGETFPELVAVIANARMHHERRRLRLRPRALEAVWDNDDTLTLHFELEAGAFATCVVRECLDVNG